MLLEARLKFLERHPGGRIGFVFPTALLEQLKYGGIAAGIFRNAHGCILKFVGKQEFLLSREGLNLWIALQNHRDRIALKLADDKSLND